MNDRPENPKVAILKMLKSLQRKNMGNFDPHNKTLYQFESEFLQEEDFEAIFDSYDVLGMQQIPKAYMYHALKMVGVEDAESVINERYAELVEEDTINKVSFVFVLETEHRRLGFCSSRVQKSDV